MSHRVEHCPFLNRADHRCSNHFSLDRLDHAFDHCFGSYLQCNTYQEMLAERRERQGAQAGHGGQGESGVQTAYPAHTGQRHSVRATHGISSPFSALSLPVLSAAFAHAHR